MLDFDAAVRDPGDESRIAPAFDSGDHLHFNSDGYAALAAAIDLDGFARRACQP